MRKLITALAASMLVATPAFAADPLEGRWKKGNLEVDIRPCGQTLCATVVAASDNQKQKALKGSGTNLIGATLIRGISKERPGLYKGSVYIPDRDMRASGKIMLKSPNKMDVSGCVLAGIVCRSREWTRVR